jgi:hypothetical protein
MLTIDDTMEVQAIVESGVDLHKQKTFNPRQQTKNFKF